nr:helicase-related protein [Nitrosococcus halophilus]
MEQKQILVSWFKETLTSWHHPQELGSGFSIGMDVQDVPRSNIRPSLGEGIVLENRTLGGRDQVLVEFPASGKRLWLPYENLRPVKGVKHRFLVPKPTDPNEAERLRLKNLAYALELWNENTGALSQLEIDPLPHQIHLVHHILASGNLNWLIADDVGLGKTIELGMLLSALRSRGMLRRVLIVTPAGLTQQWQEEMRDKFGFDEFQIYGRDFEGYDARQWKLNDFVIGSIDRLKLDYHKENLLNADRWDLIVFDEAHRLSRRQYGRSFKAADRFRLAAELRPRTDAMILLSATPHQGMQDKFQALLELVRPEWKRAINRLALNPDLVREMVFRNYKADVTDAEGNFIFKGKTTRTISVDISPAVQAFDKALQAYLQRGYNAGREQGGRMGRAIHFVMTIYRKLAASSVAAIYRALERRLERLHGEFDGFRARSYEEEEPDIRYFGEWEEMFEASDKEFFAGEMDALRELIRQAASLLHDDRKLQAFQSGLLEQVLTKNPDEKVLIFTEYRATQDYLRETLVARFGADKVEIICGGQSQDERRAAIARFEDKGQFLVSTEAGGEGINLQRYCHVVFNFDLPWNPMRLVQRIGRLYRYGQDKRVIVFNVHAPDTLDAQIMDTLYLRLDQVVRDMAVLGSEFNENLADDILGEMADLLEIEQILEEAASAGVSRTRKRIEEAMQRAREAVEKQRDLFAHVSRYDPNESREELHIAHDHLRAFIEGMFVQEGIEIIERTHKNAIWEIRLPEELANQFSSARTRWRVTLERAEITRRPGVHMLNLNSRLMHHLLDRAKSYEFGGLATPITDLNGEALCTAILRWQNDQGRRMRQEFAALLVHADGRVDTNPMAVSDWLRRPATATTLLPNRETVEPLYKMAEIATDRRLGKVANRDLHPENRQWLTSAWIKG